MPFQFQGRSSSILLLGGPVMPDQLNEVSSAPPEKVKEPSSPQVVQTESSDKGEDFYLLDVFRNKLPFAFGKGRLSTKSEDCHGLLL